MPYDVKTFSVPYVGDMDYNLFGDYNALVKRVYRDQATHALSAKWFVRGVNGVADRELNAEEMLESLELYFHQTAKSADEPAVDSIAEMPGV